VATRAYQEDEDPLAEFFAEQSILSEHARCTRSEIYFAYRVWCDDIGEERPLANKKFYDDIRRLSGVSQSKWRVGGAVVRGFTGIGLVKSELPESAIEKRL